VIFKPVVWGKYFYKSGLRGISMLTYTDIYEVLRKEKYSEVLQALPKKFIKEVSEYLSEKRNEVSQEGEMFGDSMLKNKKQLENSIAIFKELMLRRKKKLLSLVFVATETGIMKRDYENMLDFEKDMFDSVVKIFEQGDKKLAEQMRGESLQKSANSMVIFSQDIEEFVGMDGGIIGPFANGDLANLDSGVSGILVESGKAKFVDED
jgi:hypothetical protein